MFFHLVSPCPGLTVLATGSMGNEEDDDHDGLFYLILMTKAQDIQTDMVGRENGQICGLFWQHYRKVGHEWGMSPFPQFVALYLLNCPGLKTYLFLLQEATLSQGIIQNVEISFNSYVSECP